MTASNMEAAAARPKVTIGLPVYNGADYLEGTIQTLLTQTFTDFELIISDNASTDGTRAICEAYVAKDPRVRYSRLEQNLGAAPNYNRLVELARGEYFKWQAHDDECAPEFLERCVAVLDRDRSVELVYPSTHVIGAEGELLREYRDGIDLPQGRPTERFTDYLQRNFLRRSGLCNPIFGLMRTATLRRTRLIQNFLASDRSLIGHFALMGKIVELPEFLFRRRVHEKISTMADRGVAARLAWFNQSAKKKGFWTRLKHQRIGRRVVHFNDYFRAIRELVDDPEERKRCTRAVAWLLLRDPKWAYIDLKYSLGFGPTNKVIMQQLDQSKAI